MSSDHLMTVLNDVLDWSKIESNKLALEEKPYQLHACIKVCARVCHISMYVYVHMCEYAAVVVSDSALPLEGKNM